MRRNEKSVQTEDLAQEVSENFAEIYFYGRPSTSSDTLSHQAIRALAVLAHEESVTIRTIANHLGCAHNTASELIGRLAERKLVSKTRQSDDERNVRLSLTRVGVKVMEEQTRLCKTKLAHCLEEMSDKEREKLAAAFSLLRDRLKGTK